MAGSDYGTTDDTSTDGMRQGVAQANTDGGETPEYKRECADVKHWLAMIDQARKFDENARKQYALNRRTARGDRRKFEVAVPICQSYIDVLNSFLYAKNPQVSCTPSGMTQPPPAKDIEAMILAQQQTQGAPGQMPGTVDNAMPMAMAMGMTPPPAAPGPMPAAPGAGGGGLAGLLSKVAPGLVAKLAGGAPGAATGGMPPGPPQPTPEEMLQQQVTQLLAPYQKKRNNAKQLAETSQLVVATLWTRAKLKLRAKRTVKSGLTVGLGVLKAFWMERMGQDPTVQGQIDDLLEMMANMQATKKTIEDDQNACSDIDAQYALLEQQHDGLMKKVEVMVARGFVIEFINAENFQVSIDVDSIADYQDASWLGHRTFKTLDQAKADYPDVADKLGKLANWKPKKPRYTPHDDGAPSYTENDITAKDADQYTKDFEGTNEVAGAISSDQCCVCIWEVVDRTTTNVLTFIEGLECYAKKPYVPDVSSTRGHPYFLYTIGEIDGSRHPRSLTTRSQELFDEYDRMRSGSAKHRRRALPKLGFDATNYDATEIAKLEEGEIGEMVGLKPIDPSKPLKDCVFPIEYNNYDEALYNTDTIRGELETIWGIQEADAQGIQTAKTATEAGIEEQGKQSRVGFMVSGLDDMLNDLAQYTLEVAIQKMDPQDVESIAGPWALWPQGMGVEDLNELVDINIKAGSSGNPATAQDQQAWSTLLPVLQNSIKEIGQLRGSDPQEIADCQEALVEETFRRAGDTTDASQFLPDPPRTPPPPPPGPPPIPLMDSALMGPQTAALMEVLAAVKGRVISEKSAKGVILAAFPHVPPDVVDQMVEGAMPLPGDPQTQLDSTHATTVPPPAQAPVPGASAPTGATA